MYDRENPAPSTISATIGDRAEGIEDVSGVVWTDEAIQRLLSAIDLEPPLPLEEAREGVVVPFTRRSSP